MQDIEMINAEISWPKATKQWNTSLARFIQESTLVIHRKWDTVAPREREIEAAFFGSKHDAAQFILQNPIVSCFFPFILCVWYFIFLFLYSSFNFSQTTKT